MPTVQGIEGRHAAKGNFLDQQQPGEKKKNERVRGEEQTKNVDFFEAMQLSQPTQSQVRHQCNQQVNPADEENSCAAANNRFPTVT